MPEIDRIAKAGYDAWRLTSSHPLPDWAYLSGAERHRWRLSAEGITARDIRTRCCIGLYIAPWMDASPRYRLRWHQVADAMAEARATASAA